MKLRRSMLLVPAGDERKITKALAAPTDVVMLDLQDSVPFDDTAKARAREVLGRVLTGRAPSRCEVNVRVNAIGSAWLRDDLEMVVAARADSVTFAELRTVDDVRAFEQMLRDIAGSRTPPRVLLDVETPAAICNLEAIAAAATLVDGMMVGVNDYALEVHSSGALFGQKGEPSQDHLTWIRPKTVAVARMHGWSVADAVMLADPRDLAAAGTAMHGSKRMGFDGWIVLYPPQLDAANAVFGPSPTEVVWAEEVVGRYAREQAQPVAERNATVPRQHLQLARYLLERREQVREISSR